MFGKRVVDDLYVHIDWLEGSLLAAYSETIANAQAQLSAEDKDRPNVAKINLGTGRVSLLHYPKFDRDPFPELLASWTFVDGPAARPHFRRYEETLNPPVLHRKELLVGPGHPFRESWSEVTRTAEALGLFENGGAIGFRLNWQRAIAQKGFILQGDRFVPLGNEVESEAEDTNSGLFKGVRRHLTALARTSLSAPVQLLLRHGLLETPATFFDYGCGRGGDIAALAEAGFDAHGWDPHFAPEGSLRRSDVVNLGFVLNVIEDSVERVDALQRAFALAHEVLAVGVMLYPSQIPGIPYQDGYLSSRHTFQKYFEQSELRDYLEEVLHEPAFLVAPGIAFVFADKVAEQRFAAGRHRRRQLADRLLQVRPPLRPPKERNARPRTQRPSPTLRLAGSDRRFSEHRVFFDAVWSRALDLGRWPEEDEMPSPAAGLPELSPSKARRLMEGRYDNELLAEARTARTDDVLVFLVTQLLRKRAPYRQLEPRLQRDIKVFFGDYGSSQSAALRLLSDCADSGRLLDACQEAATCGLGWIDRTHSLQFHIDLVDRLPAILRAYVTCGLVLWDAESEVQLLKIHIESGKLSLLEYDEFDQTAVPSLRRRIKVNIRTLSYDVFEYGSSEFPKPVLLWKSRFLNEEQPGYAEQLAFDEHLASLGLLPDHAQRLTRNELDVLLESRRMAIEGLSLVRSRRIPGLDERCGDTFSYRDFIECGETQRRLGLTNLPLNPESYNALFDLATQLLDPLVEYFGLIRLTYGFASATLARAITGGIAPKLDQHVCCERNPRGQFVCDRLGASCDFVVDDEDMFEVARWIVANLPFDRLYVYGRDRPLHLSYGPQGSRLAYLMTPTARGTLVPRAFS